MHSSSSLISKRNKIITLNKGLEEWDVKHRTFSIAELYMVRIYSSVGLYQMRKVFVFVL